MDERRGAGLTWLWFTLARVGLFAVVLVVLLLVMPAPPWVSTIVAAVIAFCLSVIFLAGPRSRLSRQLHDRRSTPSRDTDGESEDAALDTPDFRS
ncbi:DUF4229 domain-containing protein [Naasia sp. SYSU D00948]|uniref:DUF4229 domain-containing protein n=1 Tax=Naasia sp. SYSU D00948 TaxID=2817379 RepID=UPI001B306034|nr:DUF4229 domain-containing protein [Naasia sp. SYSU D00948]